MYRYPRVVTAVYDQGEGTQPPSLLSPPGPGSERLCNAMETQLPHSPSLIASWEIADRHPNQTICPTRDKWPPIRKSPIPLSYTPSSTYSIYISMFTTLPPDHSNFKLLKLFQCLFVRSWRSSKEKCYWEDPNTRDKSCRHNIKK